MAVSTKCFEQLRITGVCVSQEKQNAETAFSSVETRNSKIGMFG